MAHVGPSRRQLYRIAELQVQGEKTREERREERRGKGWQRA